MPPSTPRRICRPSWLPTVRAACLAMVSTMPWRRLVPHSKSLSLPARLRAAAPLGPGSGRRRRRSLDRTLEAGARWRGSPAQDLVGRLAVHRRVVLAADRAARPHRRALLRRDRAHAAARRADQRALHRHRHALLLQRRHQRLADAELRDHLGDVELRIGDEGLGRGAHRLLVARRVGAQRVLDAVAELAEDLVRARRRETASRSTRRRPWSG